MIQTHGLPLKFRRQKKIFILSGPSGSGKTTLHDMLLTDSLIRKYLAVTVSATTRTPRPGEKNGRDYFFFSEKMFQYKVRAGHFLEHATVFGRSYGTMKSQVRSIWREGKNVLLCIDVQGCRDVLKHTPQAITIFVKTPSLAILVERLKKRGTEDAKTLQLRLKMAKQELKEAKHYKYVLVNDDLSTTYAKLRTIVKSELGLIDE